MDVNQSSELRESRLRSGTHRVIEMRTMDDLGSKEELEQLQVELTHTKVQLGKQQKELTAAKTKLADADQEIEAPCEQANKLETELGSVAFRAKVKKLREVDAVWKELTVKHKQLHKLDAARVKELKVSMAAEKERLLTHVDDLKEQLAEGQVSQRSSSVRVYMPDEEDESGGGEDDSPTSQVVIT